MIKPANVDKGPDFKHPDISKITLITCHSCQVIYLAICSLRFWVLLSPLSKLSHVSRVRRQKADVGQIVCSGLAVVVLIGLGSDGESKSGVKPPHSKAFGP